MPDETVNSRGPRTRGRRVAVTDRGARHLELVTLQWLAELGDRRAVLPRSRRGALGRRKTLAGPGEPRSQAGSSPLRSV
jgi:hypothetical protein